MRRVRASGPRVALSVALAASAAALSLTVAGPSALLGPLGLVVASLLFISLVEVTRQPRWLVRLLPRACALVLLVTGLVAWLSRSVGALVLEPSTLALAAGPLVLAIAAWLALAPRDFPVGRALAPAIIGVLCVAGLDPSPDGYEGTALPFFRGSEHNGFAERYIALAVVVLLALWAAAILERGPRWRWRTAATLAVSVLAAAALAATGVVGLPLLQPHIEKAVASTLSEGTTGLAGESTLGEFAELAVSHRRVLDLQASVEGGQWLLPSQVFTEFSGNGWSNPPAFSAIPPRVIRPALSALGRGPLVDGIGSWFETDAATSGVAEAMRITQASADWPLLLPRGAAAVTADAWLLQVDAHGLPRAPSGRALSLYGALWSPQRSARRSLGADEQAAALTLPPVVDPRLRALAHTLAAAPDALARVEATVRHLQGGYRYTLAPGAFRTADPLAEFLFEKKAGYCEYFASAAVVLLRLQGIPARFVKGLAVGPHTDQGGGLHVVRESAAHAWVEAFVPGRGWVEADPTPPGQFQAARPRSSFFARTAERARAALSSAWARLVAKGPLAFARWLGGRLAAGIEHAVRTPSFWGLAAAAALGPWLVRALRAHARRPPPPPRDAAELAVPDGLRALVFELERRWAAAGVPRPPARGLLEHAEKLSPGDGDTATGPSGKAIVAAYYRSRFGGESPRPGDVDSLRRAFLNPPPPPCVEAREAREMP